ncbi:MAG: aspartate ammonia-lyase [Deltaproteobacteria bacterium]
MKMRIEKDLLGELEVPADAYYGVHTQRAVQNFNISGRKMNPALIRGMAIVKKACCLANAELELIDKKKADAIIQVCDEIIGGKLADQFPVDALQGGAGTSTNMNLNEVIANRANELLGGKKGDCRPVDPIEDVNLNQSTNDVYPTALKVAAIYKFRELSQAVAVLQGAFQKKEKEFARVVKIGRTELREAVPMTLGAEFSAFAEAFARDRWRTFKCEERLRQINLGGTAVGTGLTAPRSYIFLVSDKLRELTGFGLARGENMVDQTANSDAFVEVSGILKACASNLIKISNDLRLLSLLGEIRLPALQAGSSVMPGKVNPVMLEAAMQAGLEVIARDGLVTEAASRASLQINEFLPLLADALLGSIDILLNIVPRLATHVEGIKADEARCREYLEKDPMLITALLPVVGYKKAQELLKDFEASGKDNLRIFLEGKLGKETVDKAFSPEYLTALGYKNGDVPKGDTPCKKPFFN